MDQEVLEQGDKEEEEESGEEEEETFEAVDNFSDLSDDEMAGDDAGDSDDDMMLKLDGDSDDDDEEESDGQNDDEIEELPDAAKKQKKKPAAKKNVKESAEDKKMRKLKKLSSDPSLMASAEEFADLIEQYQDDDGTHGTGEDVSNRDRSSAKQLKWEQKRHHDAPKFKSKFKKGGARPKFGASGEKSFKKR